MPTYRCLLCPNDAGKMGRNFEAVAGPGKPVKCPMCGEPFLGLDFTGIPPGSQAQPRGQGSVVEVAVIHYDRPRAAPDMTCTQKRGFVQTKGQGFACCDPKKLVGTGDHYTGVPVAVSCMACRATKEWQQDAAAEGIPVVPSDKDVEIMVGGVK